MFTYQRVVLTGFSGTGKSTVARLLANELGWRCLDLDDAIQERFGQTVTQIFESHGEAAFRRSESEELLKALSSTSVVIATGGGAVVATNIAVRALLDSPDTFVVALDALTETILARLGEQQIREGATSIRPLLMGLDPIARIAELKCSRQQAYDQADLTLIVDAVTPEFVARELSTIVRKDQIDERAVTLRATSGKSRILVDQGIFSRLGTHIRQRWPNARQAWIISDDYVGPLYTPQAIKSLDTEGFNVLFQHVPRGEGSKSLPVLGTLYDWMLDHGIERGDVVVALGGGVIGDLAGFAAATCLRGIGLTQVPTSLLAMVDSSVGGKTGINHRAGKNLIGAFHQPSLVLVDPTLLQTLPAREVTSGWAEIIKHALIQPSTPGGERGDLVRFLQRNAAALIDLREPAISYLIHRNIALKAAVVAIDEREAGARALLNFGHTLGHAIEAAGYLYLHGESVALGIRAAMRIGAAVGTCGSPAIAFVDDLLDRFGLPVTASVDPNRVLDLLGSDKKRTEGRQRWILPAETGVVIRDDVPLAYVTAALASLSVAAPKLRSV